MSLKGGGELLEGCMKGGGGWRGISFCYIESCSLSRTWTSCKEVVQRTNFTSFQINKFSWQWTDIIQQRGRRVFVSQTEHLEECNEEVCGVGVGRSGEGKTGKALLTIVSCAHWNISLWLHVSVNTWCHSYYHLYRNYWWIATTWNTVHVQ